MSTDADTVVVPDDLSVDFPIHLRCRICYPDPEQANAICGARVMGVSAPRESVSCGTCKDIVMEHIEQHLEDNRA